MSFRKNKLRTTSYVIANIQTIYDYSNKKITYNPFSMEYNQLTNVKVYYYVNFLMHLVCYYENFIYLCNIKVKQVVTIKTKIL
jgi:hypothetical protein